MNTKEPYGWCIENNHKGFGFDKHFNHKVYNSREIALEAVKQMKKTGIYNQIDTWRIFPVYSGEPEMLDNILDLPLKIEEDGR